jgi:hypothetical protein
MAAKQLNRAALALRLEISETRVQQLTSGGVLKRVKGKYDELESALALLKWFRRNEREKETKLRLLMATAVNNERRLRQQMKKLATVDEIHDVLTAAFEAGQKLFQAGCSEVFYPLSLLIGADKARVMLTPVYDNLRLCMLGFKAGSEEMCKRILAGALQDDTRLDVVIEELRAAVKPTAEAELSEQHKGQQ